MWPVPDPSQHHISELHGNSNREYCKDCGKDYIRGESYAARVPSRTTTTGH